MDGPAVWVGNFIVNKINHATVAAWEKVVEWEGLGEGMGRQDDDVEGGYIMHEWKRRSEGADVGAKMWTNCAALRVGVGVGVRAWDCEIWNAGVRMAGIRLWDWKYKSASVGVQQWVCRIVGSKC